MDQSRCKYRLRSKGSLTNVTQPRRAFRGAFQPAFVLVVGDRWRDEPWWTSGATPRPLLSEYAKYAAGGVGVRLADMRIEVPEAPISPRQRCAGRRRRRRTRRLLLSANGASGSNLLARSRRRQASRSIRRAWLCPEIRRQEAKQPFGDELVALRCPMAASGGVPVGRRAVKGYVWDARSLEMTNQGDVG
jgi:hypothetical protein